MTRRKKSNPSEQILIREVRLTAAMLKREYEQFTKIHGLSTTQFFVLRAVRSAGSAAPVAEIRKRLPSQAPDVSRLIDRLVRAKLVDRREGDDRRTMLVTLTPSGEMLLDEVERAVASRSDTLFSHMSPEDQSTLIELLQRARGSG